MSTNKLEDKILSLENLIKDLKKENNIDKAINLHQQGMKEIEECKDIIQNTKQKVEKYIEE